MEYNQSEEAPRRLPEMAYGRAEYRADERGHTHINTGVVFKIFHSRHTSSAFSAERCHLISFCFLFVESQLFPVDDTHSV